MATTKKVENLRVVMLEARAAYSEFMETHSRPMTPEEIEAAEKFKKQLVTIPITDKIMKKVKQQVERIEAEKR